MSDHKPSEVAATTPAVETQPPQEEGVKKTKRPAAPANVKLVRQVDTLKARLEKQTDQIKKLKEEIVTLRSANSRVRRIPKTSTPAATADASTTPS